MSMELDSIAFANLTQSNTAPVDAFSFTSATMEFAAKSEDKSNKRPVRILARTRSQ